MQITPAVFVYHVDHNMGDLCYQEKVFGTVMTCVPSFTMVAHLFIDTNTLVHSFLKETCDNYIFQMREIKFFKFFLIENIMLILFSRH